MADTDPADAERTAFLQSHELALSHHPPTTDGSGATGPTTTPVNHPPGYELVEPIGAGGFGTVYRAKQLKFGREVALKVLRARAFADRRPEAEALALGRCQHPNVVQVFDFGEHEGRPYIVMELLEGDDLGRHVATAGPLGEREAWGLIRQAAVGLAHAAGRGMIHCDVKPGNLFLVRTEAAAPLVKVMDFGLARTRKPDEGPPGDAEDVAGTPVYMAPEQWQSPNILDHRGDIYSLGATMFFAATGRVPFSGKAVWDVLEQKNAPPPVLAAPVSARTADLVRRMMAPDPAERVGSYDALIAEIDAILADAPPASTSARRRRLGRRLALALTLAAVAGLAAWAWPDTPDLGTYRTGSRYEALFDRRSLAGWRSSGGSWEVVPDEDRLGVLTGTGVTAHGFDPTENYALTVGLDLGNAKAAWVGFGGQYCVRVTREAATFGTRANGRFRELGPPAAFPPPERFEGKRPYLEVKVERVSGGWRASFDGKPLGAVRGAEGPAEIVISAEGGQLRADTVTFAELVRRPE